MKFKYIALAAAVIFAASCSKEPSTTPAAVNMVEFSFDASFDNESDAKPLETKTVLNGVKSEWVAGDKIGFVDKTSKAIFSSNATSISGETVSFSVTLPDTTKSVMAFYPYDSSITSRGTTVARIAVTLPENQKAVKGGFDPSCAFATSPYVEPGKAMSFKNAVGMVKITLDRNDVKVIMLESNNNDVHLTGRNVDINHSGVFAKYTSNSSSVFSQKAAISQENAEALEPGDYYICLIPTPETLSFNFTLTYITTEGAFQKTSTKPLSIKRNTITNLGTPDVSESVELDNYTRYISGEPLTIAGKTYSVATTPAELLKSTGESSVVDLMTRIQSTSDKVFFLESIDGGKFNYAPSIASIKKNVALVSNSDELVPIVPTYCSKLISGSIGFKNLTIDMSGIDGSSNKGYLFNNNSATTDADGFFVENCDIKNVKKVFFHGNDVKHGIKNFAFKNCKIGIGANKIYFLRADKTEVLDHYKNVDVTNCTFYSNQSDSTLTDFCIFQYAYIIPMDTEAEHDWSGITFKVNNNVLYNLVSMGTVLAYQATSFEMNNNVFSAPDGKANTHTSMILQSSNQSDTGVAVTGNIYYGNENWRNTRYSGKALFSYSTDGKLVTGEALQTPNQTLAKKIGYTTSTGNVTDNPIQSADIASGSFTLSEDYQNVGVQGR